MVDPEAPVLFVYFHGSGTRAASGATGSVKMNKLADMGFAGLSFDLPYHQDGSPNPKLMDTQKFADYVKNIVETYRQPGQKVVLWGHSFGPDVVFEVGTRYPHLADALVGISPGGFDKVTKDWFSGRARRSIRRDFLCV
jgi:pimeloyl-ACP methyl ester carboxylesterase